MLIVVEGLDRTGKSTLAGRLAERVDGTVVHAGPPRRGAIEEYETSLDLFHPGERALILDRFHVGEYVWPTIFGRDTDFSRPVQRHVEMFMHSRGALVVYGMRDPAKLAPELVVNDEPLKPEDIGRATHLFTKARVFSGRFAESWDYEREGDEKITNIIDDADELEKRVRPIWDVLGGGWVGNPTPRLLLVGDELGPEKSGRRPPRDVPFAPYGATSGHYLMRAIKDFWHGTAIINAYRGRTGQPHDLFRAWSAFGYPRIVALGERAAEALERYDLPYEKVPHPQYWRRFRWREFDEYSRAIQEAAS